MAGDGVASVAGGVGAGRAPVRGKLWPDGGAERNTGVVYAGAAVAEGAGCNDAAMLPDRVRDGATSRAAPG